MLDQLAHNLRWCWDQPTTDFFASLDPDAWARVGHDPVALLGEISAERFAQLAADPLIVDEAHELAAELDRYLLEDKWFQTQTEASARARTVAYFSAEFGLTSVMPQYSGGLGILAGDYLKAASDQGLPVVGVGLFYGAGYYRQSLSRDGWQRETYPLIDPHNLPLSLLREPDGSTATVSLRLPQDRVLHARIWVAQVGRVPLLLLDSAVATNDEASRAVTDRLYGGSSEHRLEQELLLGIGGIRALRVYQRLTGIKTPDVYHCNESHAGLISVERIRELTQGSAQLPFDSAVEAVKSGTLYTTHTPTSVGIDRFGRDLMAQHLDALGLNESEVGSVLQLGAETYVGGNPDVFNMADFGIRMARATNGVSQLHEDVSRRIFGGLWPGFDASELPITHITNGVHGPTWRSPAFQAMALDYMTREGLATGSGWAPTRGASGVPDSVLWAKRRDLRAALVRDARKRLRESWIERGATPAELTWTETALDPDVLTIGFARRVPSYKRLTLILQDPERLKRLLTNDDFPVQMVIAGKSHPDDEEGVSLIQRLVQFADEADIRDRIVFLPNYDMGMAQVLLPGCDVWLNNPLRPYEASGTSGMKAALNGVLNLSILDGWWAEMYDGSNGWAIPSAEGVEDPYRRDQLEAAALYDLIEHAIAPRFYDRDPQGIPRRWLEMVRHTLLTLGPRVQAGRMVRQYARELYGPVAKASQVLDNAPYTEATQLAQWKQKVRSAWPSVSVSFVDSSVPDIAELGDRVTIKAGVELGGLEPGDVAVQLLSGRVDEQDSLTDFVITDLQPVGRDRRQFIFISQDTLEIAGPIGYAIRVVPRNELLGSYTDLGLSRLASPDAVAGHAHTSMGN